MLLTEIGTEESGMGEEPTRHVSILHLLQYAQIVLSFWYIEKSVYCTILLLDFVEVSCFFEFKACKPAASGFFC